jgi:hypothetical protein
LGLESKKQSGLTLPCGIYRCSITAFRIHVSPLQTSYARFGKTQGRENWKLMAAHSFTCHHIRCILIFGQRGKLSLAPGFSPVIMVEKTSESRFNSFGVQKPVETGFILVTTGFTRLKAGANERRSKTDTILHSI